MWLQRREPWQLCTSTMHHVGPCCSMLFCLGLWVGTNKAPASASLQKSDPSLISRRATLSDSHRSERLVPEHISSSAVSRPMPQLDKLKWIEMSCSRRSKDRGSLSEPPTSISLEKVESHNLRMCFFGRFARNDLHLKDLQVIAPVPEMCPYPCRTGKCPLEKRNDIIEEIQIALNPDNLQQLLRLAQWKNWIQCIFRKSHTMLELSGSKLPYCRIFFGFEPLLHARSPWCHPVGTQTYGLVTVSWVPVLTLKTCYIEKRYTKCDAKSIHLSTVALLAAGCFGSLELHGCVAQAMKTKRDDALKRPKCHLRPTAKCFIALRKTSPTIHMGMTRTVL